MSDLHVLAGTWCQALDDLTGCVLGFGRIIGDCIGYAVSPYELTPMRPIAREEHDMLSQDPYTYINNRAAQKRLCCGDRLLQRQETYPVRYSQTNKASHRRDPGTPGATWSTPAARVAIPAHT